MFHPHVEKFNQVRTVYDHPLPSYSVLAADMLHDHVTLTFRLLILVNRHT